MRSATMATRRLSVSRRSCECLMSVMMSSSIVRPDIAWPRVVFAFAMAIKHLSGFGGKIQLSAGAAGALELRPSRRGSAGRCYGARGEITGDFTAAGTAAFDEAVVENLVPRAADDRAAAAGAIGRLPFVVGDVADVAVADAHRAGDLSCARERGGGRAGLVGHLEIGMKRGEVQRHGVAQVFQHPAGEPPGLLRVVVLSGDHEIGDLEPDTGLALEPPERVEHRIEVRESELLVKPLGERLQVHVGGVAVAKDPA